MVLLLPRRAVLWLGTHLADLFFRFSRREKAIALENLSAAFGGEKSPDEILKICRDCFRNLGKQLMEVLKMPRLNSENLDSLIIIDGRQNIDDALKAEKGVIILTAHFGNWELLAAGLSLSGYDLSYIVRPLRSRQLDALLNRLREGAGGKPIQRGASIKGALKCLKRNGLLGILADIDTKVDGVFVDFFGRPAFTPRGPVSLALRTGAALVPTHIVRQKDNKHIIVAEKALELKLTGDLEEDIRINTARGVKILESYIRKYPEQWIWIHERWKTQPDTVNDNSAAPSKTR